MLVDGEQIDRAGALLEPLSVGQIELDHRTRKIVPEPRWVEEGDCGGTDSR